MPSSERHPLGGHLKTGHPHVMMLARAVAYGIALLMVAPYGYHLLRGTQGHLCVPADDFYYYLVVAKNFVGSGRLSFDGITVTNGFHPLYMVVLVGLVKLAGGTGGLFFFLLALLLLAACVATIEIFFRLATRLFPGSPYIPAVAVLVTLESVRGIVWAMETSFTIPLYLLTIYLLRKDEQLTPGRSAALGFVCCLLILSRLDSALFLILATGLLVMFHRGALRLSVRSIAMFAVGGLAAPAYFLVNLRLTGRLMPVSAQAKHMKEVFAFRWSLLRDLLGNEAGAVALVLTPLAIILLLAMGRKLIERRLDRLVLLAVFGFPVLFYWLLALRSDWILHAWYYYPLATSIGLSLLLVFEATRQRWPVFGNSRLPRLAMAAACALTLLLAGRLAYQRTLGFSQTDFSIYDTAVRLATITQGQQGVYAMGDRAGLTALLLSRPVVQLEGLIADQKMVDHIRHRDSLNQVLKEYGVQRLILSIQHPVEDEASCARVAIPDRIQAGDLSPKMTGFFCRPPVAHFSTLSPRDAGRPWHTYVFDATE